LRQKQEECDFKDAEIEDLRAQLKKLQDDLEVLNKAYSYTKEENLTLKASLKKKEEECRQKDRELL